MIVRTKFAKVALKRSDRFIRGLCALVLVLSLFGVPPVQRALAAGTISLTTLGTAYTENFDTLASSGTSSTVPNGWDFSESGGNTTYTAGTGSNNAGDTYSFGSSGSTERAFGGLRSGSVVPTIGASFTNNTGATITDLAISYTGEEWRLGAAGRTDRLDFQYSTDATSLTTGTWTEVDALDFTTPATSGTAGARDGNATANRTAVSYSITGLSVANGAAFWIRWTDYNASGSDDGLAVDDFSLTAAGNTDPLIAVVGTLNAFSSVAGAPSAEQSYTVAGSNLTNDIEINAPTDFEIAETSGGPFGPSLTLHPSGGSVPETPIYVRFNRATAGISNGNIEHASTGATPQNVTVSGTALPPTTWVAYNDSAWNSGEPNTNITQISLYDTTSGMLVKRADGSGTGVTAAFSLSSPSVDGTDFQVTSSGADAAAGTDAYTIFNGHVSTDGVVNGMGSYADWWIDLTLSGLDPVKTYMFAGTSVRNSSSYADRNSTFILSSDDAAINASSSGVTVVDDHTIAFNTGYNAQGYVVRWVGINPGADGTIIIRTRASTTVEIAGSDDNAYGLSVFMLAEEMGDDPTITTVGTLTPFSTTPGTPSDAQTYTVSGNNLEADLAIAAPAGFELSTDGSTYSGNLTLPHTSGSVPATTIYVRLTGAVEGVFSGNIAHTSTDATQVDIAVSGEVAVAPTIATFQQGVAGYAGTVDTYLESEDATADNSTATTLVVDLDPEQHILLRFDNIFGTEPGQIPPGASIQSASLEINVTNGSDEGALLHRMLQSWDDTDTWNTWGDGIDADGIEAEATAESSSNGSSSGTATIDVTPDVQVWSNNPASNRGWAWLPPSGDDSWQFRSAEGTTPPKLTVTYFPPSIEPPAAPTDLSATVVSSARIDLSWTDNADNESSFEVWSANSSGTPIALLETVGANTTSHASTGLASETEYCYMVRATNGVGDSAYTDVACATTEAAPTTVTIQVRVSQSSDDAEESLEDNSVTVDSTDLEMIRESQIDDYDQVVGIRFQNVAVPAGATIVSAHIEFEVDETSSDATSLTLYGQAHDNPPTFAETDNDISNRSKTTASVAWTPDAWDTVSEKHQTNDLTAIVQEIVNRGGWASGNALVFIVEGSGQRIAEAYDGESANAPLLVIEYTTATGPLITLIGDPLGAFSTTPGLPSAAQTYTVSGSNLEADIEIAAPTGFELSTDGSTYAANLTLPQSGGTVGATTIYVRLTGAEGAFSGNITHESSGATPKNVAVSGTVGWCVTVSFQQGTEGYAGARDAHIRQNDPTYNYGTTTPLTVDSDEPYSSDGYDASALLYWDLSSIPTGSTIESASITVYVEEATDSATPGYDLYEMTQAWAEGTGNGAATGDGATWNTYDGVNAWPNGAGGAGDRGGTALANFAATSTGSYQVALNDAGEAVLENWINAPANNRGFMIHAGEEDNGLDFTSKEGSTVANRPRLTVTYCLAPTTPYITVSGTLNPFASTVGVPSAAQSYTVLGLNLTGDLVITAPADFEISTTSGSGLGFSVSLTPDGNGTVAATTIYVRFLRSTTGTSSGNITHTSPDAATQNIAVSGTATSAPPAVSLVQPTDDATGVSIPPTLEVTVTDPEADTMSVSFYGRPVGTGGGEDFTFFVYPDTQSHVDSESEAVIFNAMSQYVVAHQVEFNVAFATHVGDIVMNASTEAEWIRADAAMDILDPAGVPYSVGPGNHDDGGYTGNTYYPDYFGTDRFSGKPWYGSAYDSDNFNNYSLFSASGMDFIVINLQYNSTSEHWDWADALLKANPTRRGIIAQHNILNVDNSWQSTASQNLYNALQDNPNLFLMLCGHMHSGSDGSAYRLETRTGMDPVHILLTDYQDYNSSGNTGYMRILTFRPATDEIYAQIYSPYVDAHLTSESNYEQFTMTYDMDGSVPFELLDTVNDVASGAIASVTWSGLDESTEYEWYADVSDGGSMTTGPTWSFTTGTTSPNHTVTFNANGGAGAMSNQVANVPTALTLNAFTRAGYAFAGWNTAANGSGTAYADGATYAFAADLTLYAQWTALSNHTVTFNANGGAGAMSNQVANVPTALTLNAFTRAGYAFAGWNTAANGSGTAYADGATYAFAADVTLYAQWTVNQYTLTFDSGGGSAVAPITQNFGSAITAPDDPTRTGYTFAGWEPDVPATMPAENLTLTAQWTVNQYTLTFDSAGGSAVAPITQDFGSAITAPDDPTRTGYTFAGWDPDVPTTMPAENLTLTAQWTLNQYTLTFNSAGGSAVASITQDFGSAITAPDTPTRTGYTFAGWEPDVPTTMPAANLTLTAQWTVNQYTLTFDSAGGSAVTPITQDFGSAITAPDDPTRTGYTFAGWDPDVPTTMPAENLTLTAQWTANAYTVTFDGNGGDVPAPVTKTVTFDAAYGTLADTGRSGYTFEGWFTAAGSGAEVTAATIVSTAANHTLYAHWTANEYTLTYVADAGGTLTGEIVQTVAYGADGTPVTAVPNTGYHFVNWSDGSTANPRTDTNITANINVTATFALDEYTLDVNVTPEGSGSVKIEPAQAVYGYGSVVTLTAQAAEGWTFTGWTGDVISVASLLTLTMDAAKTITATFSPNSPVCVPITDVTLHQITLGEFVAGDTITFSAMLQPLGLTTPYSYTINGGPILTGSANPLDFTLIYTEALKTVTLSVWNCAQAEPVTDTLQIVVQTQSTTVLYFPILMRATP